MVDAESECKFAFEGLVLGLRPGMSHFAAMRPSLVILYMALLVARKSASAWDQQSYYAPSTHHGGTGTTSSSTRSGSKEHVGVLGFALVRV